MTHADLVQRAGAWLRSKGCGMVFLEMVTLNSEIPDAIGWRDSGRTSYLVECKATRADFLADKNKGFRRAEASALGRFRYYLCPPGLIREDELPARWGLLYCHPKTVQIVRGRDPKRWNDAGEWMHENTSLAGELNMLYSALARLKIDMGERHFHERIHLPYKKRQEGAPIQLLAAGLVKEEGR